MTFYPYQSKPPPPPDPPSPPGGPNISSGPGLEGEHSLSLLELININKQNYLLGPLLFGFRLGLINASGSVRNPEPPGGAK